jgi:hypothetical protein
MLHIDHNAIRRGIVIFWAIWLSIVCATNLCDCLKGAGVLPNDWMFASGNLQFMRKVVSRYFAPEPVSMILLAGVIAWEALAAALFFRAAFFLRSISGHVSREVTTAFAVGLALWATFLITDEFFIAYEVEATHFRLMVAQLVSLLFLELLPDR